jgi:hypothetical protein
VRTERGHAISRGASRLGNLFKRVPAGASPAERQAVRSRIEGVVAPARILGRGPDSRSSLARPRVGLADRAFRGGRMGVATPGQLPTELEKVAFQLGRGLRSARVLEHPEGLHAVSMSLYIFPERTCARRGGPATAARAPRIRGRTNGHREEAVLKGPTLVRWPPGRGAGRAEDHPHPRARPRDRPLFGMRAETREGPGPLARRAWARRGDRSWAMTPCGRSFYESSAPAARPARRAAGAPPGRRRGGSGAQLAMGPAPHPGHRGEWAAPPAAVTRRLSRRRPVRGLPCGLVSNPAGSAAVQPARFRASGPALGWEEQPPPDRFRKGRKLVCWLRVRARTGELRAGRARALDPPLLFPRRAIWVGLTSRGLAGTSDRGVWPPSKQPRGRRRGPPPRANRTPRLWAGTG